MNRPFSFLPVLLLTLAACGGAAPPPAAPAPAGAPAPAAAPAPASGLPPVVDEAMGRMMGLFVDPSDAAIKATFSPRFLAAVPAERLRELFTAMTGELGACQDRHAAKVTNDTAALVRIVCDRGAAYATVVVNPAPPHLIEGLLLKPAP